MIWFYAVAGTAAYTWVAWFTTHALFWDRSCCRSRWQVWP